MTKGLALALGAVALAVLVTRRATRNSAAAVADAHTDQAFQTNTGIVAINAPQVAEALPVTQAQAQPSDWDRLAAIDAATLVAAARATDTNRESGLALQLQA